MDRKLPENPEIRRLILLSEQSRTCLETEVSALRHKLDIPARVKDSLKQNPVGWLAGSLASGLAASLLLRRRPAVEKKQRGIPSTLLGLTLTAARPLAKVWLASQVKQWAAGTSSSSGSGLLQNRPSTNPNSP